MSIEAPHADVLRAPGNSHHRLHQRGDVTMKLSSAIECARHTHSTRVVLCNDTSIIFVVSYASKSLLTIST